MDSYNILNTIKPKFLITKFPYNLVDPAKIIFTRKKISIIVKKGGGKKTESPMIWFCG